MTIFYEVLRNQNSIGGLPAAGQPTGFMENFAASKKAVEVGGLMLSRQQQFYDAYAPIVEALNAGNPDRPFINPFGTPSPDLRRHPERSAESRAMRIWGALSEARSADGDAYKHLPENEEQLADSVKAHTRKALEDAAMIGGRATTAGDIGAIAGALTAGAMDPINLITLPLGVPGAWGIIRTAVGIGALNAALEAGAQPAVGAWHKELGLDYTARDMAAAIATAGAGGALLGGAVKGLAIGGEAIARAAGRALSKREALAAFDRLVKNPTPEEKAARFLAERDIEADEAIPGPATPAGLAEHRRKLAEAEIKATEGIRAYHGTPHDFEKFDLSKIGTGEGAQAYGHGLYFAESPTVAGDYTRRLSFKAAESNNYAVEALGRDIARLDRELADAAPGTPQAREISARLQAAEKERKALLDQAKGATYEVNIKASADQFLDWDKPLSAQPEGIQKAVRGVVDKAIENGANGPRQMVGVVTSASRETKFADPANVDDLDGASIMEMLQKVFGSEGTSQALNRAGVRGLKYLDAASRGAGDGTRNFVVFDDNIIETVAKNGKPTGAAGTATVAAEKAALDGYSTAGGAAQEAQAAELGGALKAEVEAGGKDAIPEDFQVPAELIADPATGEIAVGTKSVREILDDIDAERKFLGDLETICGTTGGGTQ